jgi:hypothetical protein
MRVEILIFVIAGLIIANIYTEGKVLKKLLSFKKYPRNQAYQKLK